MDALEKMAATGLAEGPALVASLAELQEALGDVRGALHTVQTALAAVQQPPARGVRARSGTDSAAREAALIVAASSGCRATAAGL